MLSVHARRLLLQITCQQRKCIVGMWVPSLLMVGLLLLLSILPSEQHGRVVGVFYLFLRGLLHQVARAHVPILEAGKPLLSLRLLRVAV